MSSRFAYDDVPYDTEANAETHPSSIAALARLCGLSPAAPSGARVLEIGCGNGENQIAAATYLPHARFVGFDLASAAIDAGTLAAKASGASNVELFTADIRAVRASGVPGHDRGSFDYVVAHGMYSWVPEAVREDLLAVMHDALAPGGVGFLSINALPAWELRRALRELARDATSAIDDPAAKVAEALRLIDELGRAGADAAGFFGALSAAAREYIAHVERATAKEAPFSRYVFHDLLAEHNDAFSFEELCARLARAGLRAVCETPLVVDRTHAPFLQLLVQRADAPAAHAPEPRLVAELDLWADFTPVTSGSYRTTSGALIRPVGHDGIARAVAHAPGFVHVRDLADDDAALGQLTQQLFDGLREGGVFTFCVERPPCATRAGDRPRVAEHVRVRADDAATRLAPSAVVTSALHRSFRVPWPELALVRLLDGTRTVADLAVELARAASAVAPALAGPLAGATTREVERFVVTVLDRFTRHLFLLEGAAP